MANEHIAVAIAREGRMDGRQRGIFERAVSLACREDHVALRENDDAADRVVFDRDKGELRITVELVRATKGASLETLDLCIRELGMRVFHVSGRRITDGRGRPHTAARVLLDVESYWEAILRFTS